MEFQVKCLAMFHLFSVINRFQWFCMGGLCKNIMLMLEFIDAPFFVLHFSYNSLITLMKTDGSVLEEIYPFKKLGLSFSLK